VTGALGQTWVHPTNQECKVPDTARPMIPPPRRFPSTATCRLKASEATQLRDAADKRDVSVSSLLRQLALDFLSSTP
jgi:hypothetical protein